MKKVLLYILTAIFIISSLIWMLFVMIGKDIPIGYYPLSVLTWVLPFGVGVYYHSVILTIAVYLMMYVSCVAGLLLSKRRKWFLLIPVGQILIDTVLSIVFGRIVAVAIGLVMLFLLIWLFLLEHKGNTDSSIES